jgi:hypothetical protein
MLLFISSTMLSTARFSTVEVWNLRASVYPYPPEARGPRMKYLVHHPNFLNLPLRRATSSVLQPFPVAIFTVFTFGFRYVFQSNCHSFRHTHYLYSFRISFSRYISSSCCSAQLIIKRQGSLQIIQGPQIRPQRLKLQLIVAL